MASKNIDSGSTSAAAAVANTDKIWIAQGDAILKRGLLSQLATWLGVNVPAAVSTVAGFFTGTLWPALQKVWAFLDANVIPILGALANVWIALLKKEIELLAALWNNGQCYQVKQSGGCDVGREMNIQISKRTFCL